MRLLPHSWAMVGKWWLLLAVHGLTSRGETYHCDECEEADQLRVSLLQSNLKLSSVRADLDQVYNLHIPKSAGSSFALDAQRILEPRGLRVISQEGCYALHKGNPHLKGTITMLRSPRAHVLSQFGMCHSRWVKEYRQAIHLPGTAVMPKSFEEWLRKWANLQVARWHGDFTPGPDPVTGAEMEMLIRKVRVDAWGEPPYSVYPKTRLQMLDWPMLDGGGTVWHFTRVPYQCYSPINLQSHRLSCEKPLKDSADIDSAALLRNMEDLWFVGFAEAYQSSVCLLHSKVSAALPSFCNCRDPQLWDSFQAHGENQNSSHAGKKEVSSDVLEVLDHLTAMDALLYESAWSRFVKEAEDVEKRFGVRILCNKSLPIASSQS